MCILGILLGLHPKFPLIVLNNREESLARPTLQARIEGHLVSPCDLKHGGRWIGLNFRDGIFTCLTNLEPESVPDLLDPDHPRKSRGFVVNSFLESKEAGEAFLSEFWDIIQGFNVATVDVKKLLSGVSEEIAWFCSNRMANTKNPVPRSGFVMCPLSAPHAEVFSNLDSARYGESFRTPRTSMMQKHLRDFPALPESELFSHCSRILSELVADTFELEGELFKTRTQTIVMVRSDGFFQYHHRDLDEHDREWAMESLDDWEVIEGQIELNEQ